MTPWKTASQTTLARLESYSEGTYSHFYEFNSSLHRVVHQHMTFADFLALPEALLNYRTAAFVRNPYDRVYSGFLQLQRDIEQQPQMSFPDVAVRRLVMRQLSANAAQFVNAGYSFERWLDLVDDYQVLEVGHNSSFPLHPGHYWTHHNGAQAVNFIGRVERFEADFASLCAAFGIEPSSDVNVNFNSQDLGGGASDYRYATRMSARSLEKINRLFASDFELLGYQMLEI